MTLRATPATNLPLSTNIIKASQYSCPMRYTKFTRSFAHDVNIPPISPQRLGVAGGASFIHFWHHAAIWHTDRRWNGRARWTGEGPKSISKACKCTGKVPLRTLARLHIARAHVIDGALVVASISLLTRRPACTPAWFTCRQSRGARVRGRLHAHMHSAAAAVRNPRRASSAHTPAPNLFLIAQKKCPSMESGRRRSTFYAIARLWIEAINILSK